MNALFVHVLRSLPSNMLFVSARGVHVLNTHIILTNPTKTLNNLCFVVCPIVFLTKKCVFNFHELSWNFHGTLMELSWTPKYTKNTIKHNVFATFMELSWPNFHATFMELSWSHFSKKYKKHNTLVFVSCFVYAFLQKHFNYHTCA